MTVAATSILGRVRTQLVDNGPNQRWTDAELLQWLSDGQRAIVAAIPTAAQSVVLLALQAGTRQVLPPMGHLLIDVYRNLAGGTAGPALNYVERSLLDNQYPTWHEGPQVPQPLFWTYDEIDPAAFYVYPANDGTGVIEINYAFMPDDLADTTVNIDVRDVYQTPLLDYVMFRAHSKDADYAAGAQLAAAYLQAFTAGVSSQVPKKD